MFGMRRREFIALVGGAAAAWPLMARAQQPERMRRIGMLMNRVADDPEAEARLKAFVQGLQQLGWAEGRNVRMDVRWTACAVYYGSFFDNRGGCWGSRGRGAKNNLDNNGTGSPTSRPAGQQATKVERFTE
jgi:hypothetical protein